MLCANCQTTLPDEAIACWKCGRPIAAPVAKAPAKKAELDILVVIVTFVIAVGLFGCVGWSIPFTVWGMINNSARNYPQWSDALGTVSGLAFVVATIAFLGGVWWGAYWLITRLIAKPSEP